MDNWANTIMKILDDKTVDKQIKLYLIIHMVYNRDVELNKAYELCYQNKLFIEKPEIIDSKVNTIWKYFYKHNK